MILYSALHKSCRSGQGIRLTEEKLPVPFAVPSFSDGGVGFLSVRLCRDVFSQYVAAQRFFMYMQCEDASVSDGAWEKEKNYFFEEVVLPFGELFFRRGIKI